MPAGARVRWSPRTIGSIVSAIAVVDVVRKVDVIGEDRPYFCTMDDLLLTSPCLIGLSLLETSLHCFQRVTGRFVLRIRHSLLVCLAALLGVA